MAEAAPLIALGLQVGGQLIGGIEQNNAARAQAKVDEANAQGTLLEGEQQVLQTRREERRASGDMLASMGGSGLMIGSGSAADVLADNAYQRELEILNIRSQAATQASNLYQAAKDKRSAGRGALVQSIFGAASTAISGAGKIRSQRIQADANDAYRAAVLGGGTRASGPMSDDRYNPLAVPQPRVGGGIY